MYNVSDEYLEKINSTSKEVYWYGKVTLKSGVQILFDTSSMRQGQTSITRQLCDTNNIKIGCTCASELRITFMLTYDVDNNIYYFNDVEVNKYDFYDAEIDLTYRLLLDNDNYEEIVFNTFVASDVERSQMSLICVCYDYMTKFMKECVSEIQGTPYSVLYNACSVCGVEFGQSPLEIRDMVNGSVAIAEYDPNNSIKTWRDVVGYVAAILCGNAIIKSDNKLYIIPYNNNVYREVTSGNRYNLTLADYITNYKIISANNLRTNTEEKVKVEDGMTYKLGANPLMQYVTAEERITVLGNIIDQLSSMIYVPFNGSFFCDPSYELGDELDFTENHAGSSTRSIITKIVLKVNDKLDLQCNGDDPYKQAAENAANKQDAKETSGSVGDGVTFYDAVNDQNIQIADEAEETIFTIQYLSNGKYRQEFTAQVKLDITTVETTAGNTYTNNDCEILVTYYINGQEVAAYHPKEIYTDGTHLLDLFYFWTADIRVDQSTLEVSITAQNGTVSILNGNARGRIMQSGTAYVAPSNELLYIEVEDGSYKEKYNLNENIDYTGIIVWAYYEDEHRENVASQCTFDPAQGTRITEEKGYKVNITYTKDGKTFTTNIYLEVNYLVSIYMDKEPTKDEYFIGETLDLSGIVIKAIYPDKKDKDVTSKCTFNPGSGTVITPSIVTSNTVKINVSYTEFGVTKTCVVTLPALPVLLEEIKITSFPKTTYKVGETLDLTGIGVTAYYNNGTTADVTQQSTYEPADGTTITTSTSIIKATYTEGSVTGVDTCDLEVITFDGIEITREPFKKTYFDGQTLTLEGILVSGVWSNGDKEDITSECSYNPAEGSSVSLQTTMIQVSYTRDGNTYMETVDITVVETESSLDIKYFHYAKNDENRTITLYYNKLDEMEADGVTDLYIPETYKDSNGNIYEVIIGGWNPFT